jgi:hypothetical protein
MVGILGMLIIGKDASHVIHDWLGIDSSSHRSTGVNFYSHDFIYIIVNHAILGKKSISVHFPPMPQNVSHVLQISWTLGPCGHRKSQLASEIFVLIFRVVLGVRQLTQILTLSDTNENSGTTMVPWSF